MNKELIKQAFYLGYNTAISRAEAELTKTAFPIGAIASKLRLLLGRSKPLMSNLAGRAKGLAGRAMNVTPKQVLSAAKTRGAGLAGRAKTLWSNMTPTQRYLTTFAAGGTLANLGHSLGGNGQLADGSIGDDQPTA